ncbi:PREDICTED: transposon, partial [Prunus dulcis]
RIRVLVMLRMANRRAACPKWKHPVGPRIFKIIEKNKLDASTCIPRLAGLQTYQVTHMYGGEFVVDLRARTCSCRRWDLCGIPCGHAISAIFQRDESPIDYVDECYKPATYMKSYGPMIYPIPSMDQWAKSGHPPIHPPTVRVQPGRPKKTRSKEPAEIVVPPPPPPHPMPPNYVQPRDKLRRLFIKITCRRCGQSGHNRATCDRHSSEKQQANASVAQKEVHTEGGAVRVPRGIRGWPRSMLRDMGKRLDRGTGRSNEAPAVATEVATFSEAN